MKVQQAWIARTPLSTRAKHGLIAAGYTSKADIYDGIKSGKFAKVPQVGDTTFKEVQEWISSFTPPPAFVKSYDTPATVEVVAPAEQVNELDAIKARLDALESRPPLEKSMLTFEEVLSVWTVTPRNGTLDDMMFNFARELQLALLRKLG